MTEQELEQKLSQFKNIKPSQKLVNNIVLNYKKSIKGRVSFSELIFNQIYNHMAKWKILIPVAIIVLLVIIWGSNGFNTFNNGENLGKVQDMSKEMIPVSSTIENVDDVVDVILTFSENEGILMSEEIADANLITADSQEIIDFGQSYNENEF
jgi:hypothetical protein